TEVPEIIEQNVVQRLGRIRTCEIRGARAPARPVERPRTARGVRGRELKTHRGPSGNRAVPDDRVQLRSGWDAGVERARIEPGGDGGGAQPTGIHPVVGLAATVVVRAIETDPAQGVVPGIVL